MLKSCPYCQRIHDSKIKCTSKPVRKKMYATNKDNFRSTSIWQKKRQEIKERDMYLCRICLFKKILNSNNLQVHHIISLEEDYDLRLENDNLITLCPMCHELAESGKISKESLQCLTKTGVRLPPTNRS